MRDEVTLLLRQKKKKKVCLLLAVRLMNYPKLVWIDQLHMRHSSAPNLMGLGAREIDANILMHA